MGGGYQVQLRFIAPGPVGTTILRMTRKTAGSGFALTLVLAGL
jgi:hypothetical protein